MMSEDKNVFLCLVKFSCLTELNLERSVLLSRGVFCNLCETAFQTLFCTSSEELFCSFTGEFSEDSAASGNTPLAGRIARL